MGNYSVAVQLAAGASASAAGALSSAAGAASSAGASADESSDVAVATTVTFSSLDAPSGGSCAIVSGNDAKHMRPATGRRRLSDGSHSIFGDSHSHEDILAGGQPGVDLTGNVPGPG